MTDTAKRLYGPAALGIAAATIYTAPAATKTIVRYVRATNYTATDRTFNVSVGADAGATRIVSGLTAPANGFVEFPCFIPLDAAEFLQAFASAATAISLIVTGVEVT
jgi:hypothetical protein